MKNTNKEHENQYDSLKDITEFQNNMFNPGHYIGTGKIPPTVSAPGNAMPLAVVCLIATIVFLGFGLFLFFGNVTVTSGGLIKSQIINKIIALVIMLGISVFCLLLGFRYFKKAKVFYKEKSTLQKEKIDETVEDQLWQRTCPKCGISHDFDYPKCPNCKFSYID